MEPGYFELSAYLFVLAKSGVELLDASSLQDVLQFLDEAGHIGPLST